MILVDNLLIYAYVKDLPQHEAAAEWLDRQLNELPRVGLPWASLLAFTRLVSNPRVFRQPVPLSTAWEQVEAWLSAPSAWLPGRRPVTPRSWRASFRPPAWSPMTFPTPIWLP